MGCNKIIKNVINILILPVGFLVGVIDGVFGRRAVGFVLGLLVGRTVYIIKYLKLNSQQ